MACIRFLTICALLLSLSLHITAQEDAPPSAEDETLVLPEVEAEVEIEKFRSRWARGLAAFNAGDYERAEKEMVRLSNRYQASASLSGPGTLSRYYARINQIAGQSLIKQGDFEKARDRFMIAVRYDKRNFDARMRVGLLDLMKNDIESAEKHLAKLTQWCFGLPCDSDNELSQSIRTLRTLIYEQKALQNKRSEGS